MARSKETLDRIRRHRVPPWWLDGKLGIFIHWTIASVPAFAPVGDGSSEWLRSDRRDAYSLTPYVEWYENSLRFPDSPVSDHHRRTYPGRSYESFRSDWEATLENWDPEEWAEKFKASGAGHVVLVAKHTDGYCLWPTQVANPNRPGWHSRRDVVGELAEAVRGTGLRFGIYYCGGMDWTFDSSPVGRMADVLATIPRGAYPGYAEAQVRELIDRYRPSVLWNDVAWPSEARLLWPLLDYYYREVPDGLINDRWMPWSPLLAASRPQFARRGIDALVRSQTSREGGLLPPRPPHFDVRTPEYAVFPDAQTTPWECVRGMDRSFGYNAYSQPDDFIGQDELLWLLADVVSKGGNLLLNVGPRGIDARIPDEQATRLDWLGHWLSSNGEALVGTRPWVWTGASVAEGQVRYTASGESVFALLRHHQPTVTLSGIGATPTTVVETLDHTLLPWRATRSGLEVDLPGVSPRSEPEVIALRRVAARNLITA